MPGVDPIEQRPVPPQGRGPLSSSLGSPSIKPAAATKTKATTAPKPTTPAPLKATAQQVQPGSPTAKLLQQLAASGNYVQLFQTAASMGVLQQLTTSGGWTALGLKDPATAKEFQALYAAFKPYEAQMQGKPAVGATGHPGNSPSGDYVVWGDPANWASDALANFEQASRAGSVASNEAMIAAANAQAARSPTIQGMRANQGKFLPGLGINGPGTGAAMLPIEQAQANLQADAPNLATFMGSDQTALAENRASNIGIGEVALLAAAGFGGAIAAGAGAGAGAGGTGVASTTEATDINTALLNSDLATIPSANSADLLASVNVPADAGATAGGGADISIAAPDISGAAATPDIGAVTAPSAFNPTSLLVRGGVGAVTSAARGGNPAVGALGGLVAGGVTQGLEAVGAPSIAAGVAGSEASTAVKSGLTSPPNVSSPASGGPTVPGAIGTATPPSGDPTATANQGLDVGSIIGNITGDVVGALPYVGAGLVGANQAGKANQAATNLGQTEANLGKPATAAGTSLLNQVNAGKLPPAAQRVLDTSAAQGNVLINAAAPLNNIAQKAFGNYASGTLNAADALAVDNFVSQSRQTWLAANPGGDSGAQAAAFAQIDAQAIQLKQSLLTQELGVGQSAEAQWLTQTAEGQKTIRDGQTFAVTQLNTMFTQAMQAIGLGLAPAMAGIEAIMQADVAFGNQITSLFTGIGTAYALAGAKNNGPGSIAGQVGNAVKNWWNKGNAPAPNATPQDPSVANAPGTDQSGDPSAQYAQYPSYDTTAGAVTDFGG